MNEDRAASGTDHESAALSQILVLAIWFGVATGLLEAAVFTVIRVVPGWITWRMRERNVSLDFLWIAPLVNLPVFLIAGAGLAGIQLALRAIPPMRVAWLRGISVLVFAWLGFYVIFRVPDRLYRSAIIVLSLGVAVRFWQWYRRDLAAHDAWFRRSLAWIVALVVLAGVATRGAARLSEAAAVHAVSDAPSGAPNVLLIVLDTVRADHLSTYGYERATTPNLNRIAHDGVLFERAIATSAWTLPTHASLFTGRFVHEHGADTEHPELATSQTTLAGVLAGAGFLTAGISANTVWVTRNSGLARGFIHFEDYFHSVDDAIQRSVLGREFLSRALRHLGYQIDDRKPASSVTAHFLSWLDSTSHRPFFAFLNYYDTHAPYISPHPFHSQFMSAGERRVDPSGMWTLIPSTSDNVTPAQRSLLTAAYDGALAYLDAQLGTLFEELKRRGQFDHTLIIIVGDHGEALGDHGFYGHGNSLYGDQIHVPLIVRYPDRVPAGIRIAQPVSTADIAATILDLSGIRAPDHAIAGNSLARWWKNESDAPAASVRPIVSEVGLHEGTPASWPVHDGWVASVTSGPWHFIQQQRGRAELYRWTNDPSETNNLVDTDEGRPVAGALRMELGRARETSDSAAQRTRNTPSTSQASRSVSTSVSGDGR